MNKTKVKSFFSKLLIIILYIIILIILMLPMLFIALFYEKIDNVISKHFHPADLLNYIGLIFSIVIATYAAYRTLKVTIEKESDERKNDRRLQIYPYFRYSIIDDELKIESLGKDIEHNSTSIYPNIENLEVLRNYNERREMTWYNDLKFMLIIENIGINSAINFTILEKEYYGKKDISIDGLGDIKVGEKKHYEFKVLINAKFRLNINNKPTGSIPIKMKIAYNNITGDYYEQDLEITCSWQSDWINDTSSDTPEELETAYYGAHLDKNAVTEPIFYEFKNIPHEENKKFKNFKRT